MIIGILAIAFATGFLIHEYRSWGLNFSSFGLSLGIAVVGAFTGFLVCLFALNVFMAMPEDAKVVEYGPKIELVALKDNFQVEGSAFLFSSMTDENLKYTYIYNTDLGMTTGSIDADGTYIKYIEEDETPYVQEGVVRSKNVVFNWLFYLKITYYTIYLPEGSVIENVYEVDLE